MTVPNALDLLKAIYAALDELNALDPDAARSLRAAVESKPLLSLGQADLDEVRRSSAAVSSGGIAREADSYIERDFGLFLDGIPRGRELLDDIESLAAVVDFEELLQAAERVFVERLGYTHAVLDETERVARKEFSRVVRVGKLGELEVVCVELSRRNWYAAFYDVVYRLHPYALVLSLEPEGRALRFVYRDGPASRPRYRSLTGPQTNWEPNDNLLVWAWRLYQLRPRIGEAIQTLQRRVARALSLTPEDVGVDWPSAPLDHSGSVPGVAWEDAPRRAFESFLQLAVAPHQRRRWGLEATLRDRFPMAIAGQHGQLRYVSYEVGPPPPSVKECQSTGRSRERDVLLDLRLRSGDASIPFRLRCTLPEPDEQGRFVLEGRVYRFVAVVGDDGRLRALAESTLSEADVVDLEEDEDDDSAQDVRGAASDDAPDEVRDDPEEQDRSTGFRGLSPRAFYEFAVGRELAAVAANR